MHSFDETILKLRREGYKLTPQRLAVVRFLLDNKTHPSALTIHKELKKRYSTISFSTVYNALYMLEKVDELQSLHIFDDHIIYDPETKPHMHLYCRECKRIIDVFAENEIDCNIPGRELMGHMIDSCQVSLRGTCKDCR